MHLSLKFKQHKVVNQVAESRDFVWGSVLPLLLLHLLHNLQLLRRDQGHLVAEPQPRGRAPVHLGISEHVPEEGLLLQQSQEVSEGKGVWELAETELVADLLDH